MTPPEDKKKLTLRPIRNQLYRSNGGCHNTVVFTIIQLLLLILIFVLNYVKMFTVEETRQSVSNMPSKNSLSSRQRIAPWRKLIA